MRPGPQGYGVIAAPGGILVHPLDLALGSLA